MPNDLQLSDQDEVLLESLVLAASDNVARAPASDRDQFAPERRRAFVETSGDENVYLGTGNAWIDVSENTGLLSKLFSGGDGDFDSVNTGALSTDQAFGEVIPRSFNTTYQNTTGHDIRLVVQLVNDTGSSATLSSALYSDPDGRTNFPEDLANKVRDDNVPDGADRVETIYVPDGHYYKISNDSINEGALGDVVRVEVSR